MPVGILSKGGSHLLQHYPLKLSVAASITFIQKLSYKNSFLFSYLEIQDNILNKSAKEISF